MIACSTNSDKVVSILLEHEQNDLMLQKSNDYGENAFILACINDCHKVIPILLEHSHKVDLQKCDNDGQNAFMQACSNNSHKVVPILLEHSAKIDIHKCDNLGLNAFMLACKSNSERVVKAILLKKGLLNNLDLHINNEEHLVKAINTAIILIEGGNEEDLQVLDQSEAISCCQGCQDHYEAV